LPFFFSLMCFATLEKDLTGILSGVDCAVYRLACVG
jgi:hypothetical protein